MRALLCDCASAGWELLSSENERRATGVLAHAVYVRCCCCARSVSTDSGNSYVFSPLIEKGLLLCALSLNKSDANHGGRRRGDSHRKLALRACWEVRWSSCAFMRRGLARPLLSVT